MSNGSHEKLPKVWSELTAAISERQSLRKTLPLMEPSAPPVPPYDFHGFEVTAWILGGMGMVLLGRDPKLNRKVALKVLQSSGPEADAALIAEAQTLAKLSHPNVVTVHAVMEWEGGVFFVMEYVDGMNGREWLKECPTRREVLDVFIGAGEGLAAAHDKGIQHSDFKPENMLIGKDGRTRVADFGIADYMCVDEDGEPRTRRRPGTLEYMAPERLRGHRGDARSDQFSFCVALWRGLHGWRPHGGESVFALLDELEAGGGRHGGASARVPYWLTRAVAKGLADDPDDRYGDMHELLRALKDAPPDDEDDEDDEESLDEVDEESFDEVDEESFDEDDEESDDEDDEESDDEVDEDDEESDESDDEDDEESDDEDDEESDESDDEVDEDDEDGHLLNAPRALAGAQQPEHLRRMLAALEANRLRPDPSARRRQPKRRWLGAAAAAGLLSVGFGLGVWVSFPEAKADACDEVSRELVDFWNVDVQAEMRVVLGTRRAADTLESFASRWVAVRAQECDAAKREERTEHASRCTASVRDHLNATVTILRTPHQREGVDFEVVLAGLPAPEYCLEHPEDGEYGIGGLLELRRMDIELAAMLAGGSLDAAEQRQAEYMLAARELSAEYNIGRAIYWRAELHRLRGELQAAEDDFKRAFSEATSVGGVEFMGEAMLKLAAVAGAKGDFMALEGWAFVARSVFAQRRPDKVAELLQMQGLALVEGDPSQRERGIALLREAVDLREAQYSHFGGTRERVGWALEGLARGLLVAEQANEAVQIAEESLAIHELEYGGLTKRAHKLRRLLFVTQIEASNFDDADLTQRIILDPLYSARNYDAFVEESLWVASVYEAAGARSYAENKLKSLLATIERNELASLRLQVEEALAKLGMEP